MKRYGLILLGLAMLMTTGFNANAADVILSRSDGWIIRGSSDGVNYTKDTDYDYLGPDFSGVAMLGDLVATCSPDGIVRWWYYFGSNYALMNAQDPGASFPQYIGGGIPWGGIDIAEIDGDPTAVEVIMTREGQSWSDRFSFYGTGYIYRGSNMLQPGVSSWTDVTITELNGETVVGFCRSDGVVSWFYYDGGNYGGTVNLLDTQDPGASYPMQLGAGISWSGIGAGEMDGDPTAVEVILTRNDGWSHRFSFDGDSYILLGSTYLQAGVTSWTDVDVSPMVLPGADLAACQDELAETQDDLADALLDLGACQTALGTTQSELSAALAELAETQGDLTACQTALGTFNKLFYLPPGIERAQDSLSKNPNAVKVQGKIVP